MRRGDHHVERDQCGVRTVTLGLEELVCDRPSGHLGPHRGYSAQIDEALFWRNEREPPANNNGIGTGKPA